MNTLKKNKISGLAIIGLICWLADLIILCSSGPGFITLLLFVATLSFLGIIFSRDFTFDLKSNESRRHLRI
ncbi:MAG: hypothetical protein PHX83_05740 [Acidobacteriia bacterium]|nr:hypothetical protein [Terriglobia bacterium]